jgi:regulator of replication initiation timing
MFNEESLKLGSSLVQMTEGTLNIENLERRPKESSTDSDQSLAFWKFEAKSRDSQISELNGKLQALNQNILTLKAQTNALSKELGYSRSKNYDLDVECYLLKEQLDSKDKEIEKLKLELDLFQSNEKNWQKIIEENIKFKTKNQELIGKIGKLENFYKNLGKEENFCQKWQSPKKNDQINLKEDFVKNRKKMKKKSLNEDWMHRGNKREKQFSLEKLRIPMSYQASLSPGKTDRLVVSSNNVVEDLMLILEVESVKEVLQKVLNLKNNCKNFNKLQKFFDSLSKLIIECSPENTYTKPPTLKQVWKWITTLLEDYMKLKTTQSLKNSE